MNELNCENKPETMREEPAEPKAAAAATAPGATAATDGFPAPAATAATAPGGSPAPGAASGSPAPGSSPAPAAAPAPSDSPTPAASVPLRIDLPLDLEQAASLRIGQEVRLFGPVYTMRDAGHARALEALREDGRLPFGLEGQTLFYAGPTPPAAGRPLGSVGPTTASRMDFATPALMDAGIAACIGKGKRAPEVVEACRRDGCLYFCCVGGIAALLATHVVSSETIAWDDLGTEALRLLVLEDFPAFVAIDAQGGDLYRAIERGEEV